MTLVFPALAVLTVLCLAFRGYGWCRQRDKHERALTEPGDSDVLQALTYTGGREWEPTGDLGLTPGSVSVPGRETA